MPVHYVNTPDGKRIEVTAPEGASQAEIVAYAQKMYAQDTNSTAQPQAPTVAETYNPTEGMSTFEKVAAGAGKSIYDTGRGIKQLFGGYTPEEIDQQRREDAPLMDTGAGLFGNVGGAIAQFAIPASGAAKVASFAGRGAPVVGAALSGGAFGASQPVGTDETRAGNAGKGAAWNVAGLGIGKLAQVGANKLTPVLDDASQKVLAYAKSIGINPTLSQLTDNNFVKTMLRQFEQLPFSGTAGRSNANQVAFNKTVGKTYGANEPAITSEVHSKAKNALSAVYNDLTNKGSVALNPQFSSSAKAVINDIKQKYGVEEAKLAQNWISRFVSRSENGVVSGKNFKSFESEAAEAASAMGGSKGKAIKDSLDYLRNKLGESLSPDDFAAWKQVNRQWANMKTVEPLVAKSSTGNIPPAQLLSSVNATAAGKVRQATGKSGELGELAKVGQRFLKEPPDSGTSARQIAMRVIGNPLFQNSATAGGLYGAQDKGWIQPSTAAMIGGGLLANRYGLRAINSDAVLSGRLQNSLADLVLGASRKLAPVAATQNNRKNPEKKKDK